MKKVLRSKPVLWLAMIVALGVPIILMYSCHMSALIAASLPIYIVTGVIDGIRKKKTIWITPIYSYVLMIVFGVARVINVERFLYEESVSTLTHIVKYGSLVLLTIPILYYNKENIYKEK